MLTTVTVTGADDNTPINQMISLQLKYPFLEFGLLYCGKKASLSRWPSMEWIRLLVMRCPRDVTLRLSLHLVGDPLRDVYEGNHSWIDDFNEICLKPDVFSRVQFNTHGITAYPGPMFGLQLKNIYCATGIVFIQQLDGCNDKILDMFGNCFILTGLYDESHGAGVLPERWPAAGNAIRVGYAGGLGPHNIKEQLPLINKAAGDAHYWVDMETRVRTDSEIDTLSTSKVADVCAQCESMRYT